MADTISIREFARREGVSDTLVHQALKQGRLVRAADGRMDAARVGTAWRGDATAKPGAKSGAPDLQSGTVRGVAYGEALRLKENWLALLRRLEYEHKSGSLVEVSVAQTVVFDLCREQRDAWLAWPSKVAPFLAIEFGIADLERLTATLAAHVHDQLADLGEPEAHFASGET
ncbi:hypothetical protein [Paraburkholderia adhaesiva]|uniref:hypothetical protein n=1 Tax=Paraburkholderia adhaesiva TaxID=2883244 RepID=UPI001F19CEBB|nr:hypothetical protein [Paraburkholderia adhaesiva]